MQVEKAAAWQQIGKVLDPGAPLTAISHNARVQYTQLLLEFEKVTLTANLYFISLRHSGVLISVKRPGIRTDCTGLSRI